MEIPMLKGRRQLQAGAYDEAEKPFTLAYCAVLRNWRLGRELGRFKKRFASIGIFCLTLKDMLF
jgi:hypothetical protein